MNKHKHSFIYVPFKDRTRFQRLMRDTELLKEDIDIENGDVLTLLVDTSLYERVALNHEKMRDSCIIFMTLDTNKTLLGKIHLIN